jgi:Fungal specific transcription factor domain
VEEIVVNLPHDSSPDSRLRIPLEMMPSEDIAMQYFDYFFTNIHPYVPVLNRTSFYHQWNTNRESISPLLLEAIFACSAMMLDDRVQGQKFLALASSKSIEPKVGTVLKPSRTRRKLQRRSSAQYYPSHAAPAQGS